MKAQMKKPPPIEYLKHLFNQGEFQTLIDSASTLLKEEPGNVRAYYWRACAFMREDAQLKAFTDLEKAIDLYDEYADAYSQRGVLYFQQGDLKSAMADMNKALDLDPGNAYRYSSRAYIKASMQELESAIADYERAIELDPEDAVAHNNLGLLQEQLGYKSQAQRNLEKAAKLVVNENGELVDQNISNPVTLVSPEPEEEHSLLGIVKSVFTSRRVFDEYLSFLRSFWKSDSTGDKQA